MKKMIKNFIRGEEGATMVEYGIMVAVIAIVVSAGAIILGDGISTLFNNIGAALPAAAPVF